MDRCEREDGLGRAAKRRQKVKRAVWLAIPDLAGGSGAAARQSLAVAIKRPLSKPHLYIPSTAAAREPHAALALRVLDPGKRVDVAPVGRDRVLRLAVERRHLWRSLLGGQRRRRAGRRGHRRRGSRGRVAVKEARLAGLGRAQGREGRYRGRRRILGKVNPLQGQGCQPGDMKARAPGGRPTWMKVDCEPKYKSDRSGHQRSEWIRPEMAG